MQQFDYDVIFMNQALACAREALQFGEVPIGALVVSPHGHIVGSGYNLVEKNCSQINHAEMRAIEQAGQQQGDWRLNGHTLYVTVEPCMMCISLCSLSRIERVVFGARSPVFGFSLDKEGVLALYTRQIKNITEGVLAEPSAKLLKDFFKYSREK
ncbi:MAG: nucleoside deaminase [Candidatus Babeliaceae bacterium]|jgi:tRNA(adenine34) deaminase